MIFRNILSDGVRFLDKAYNIQMPLLTIPSLSTQLCDIYMIRYPEGNNEIIYLKDNSNYCSIEYTDKRNNSGIGFRLYATDEIGTTISFCNRYYPYEVLQPYLSTIQDATPSQDNRNKLISFYDTNKNISSLGAFSFQYCANLKNAVFPYITHVGTYTFYNCQSLQELNLSAVISMDWAPFSGCDNLKYIYINSPAYKSIDNGFGQDGQLIVDAETYRQTGECVVLTAVNNMDRLSNDNIYTLGNWMLPSPKLTEVYLKNARYITGASISQSSPKVYIDNDTLKSIGNGYGRQNCAVTSKDGRKLFMTNRDLTEFKSTTICEFGSSYPFSGNSNNLTSIDIDSETLKTIDSQIVVSRDEKTLYKVVKNLNATKKALSMTSLSCIANHCFNALHCNIEGEISLPNIKKLESSSFRGFGSTNNFYSVVGNEITECGDQIFGDNPYISSLTMTKMKYTPTNFAYNSNGKNTSLKSVDMPNVESVGYQSFYNNNQLSTCYFPKATIVWYKAFYGCQSIPSADFDSCTTFQDNVFEGCFTYNETATQKIYKLKDMKCGSVTKEYMQDNYYRIKMPCGCVCHCSDGDYTIPNYDY